MSAIRLLLIIALGMAALPAQAMDIAAGRIFFTPEQRTQLDMLRKQKAIAAKTSDEPVPETVTFNGIVRRNDGKTTVWLNNEALSESDLQNKQSIVGSIGRDGRVTLQAPQSAVELKVGQSATLFSGKVDESFTQRPTTAKPQAGAETKKTESQGANKTPDSEENRKTVPQQ